MTHLKKGYLQMKATEDDPYRVAFEAANVGKSVTLPSGEAHANRMLCEMLGYTREEMCGKKWQDLTHPDDIESGYRMVEDLLKGVKDSIRVNKRYIHKNGSCIWADANITLHRDMRGEPLYFITTVIDISDYKRLEAVLHENIQKLNLTFDEAPVGIAMADFDGTFIRCNKTFCNYLGYSPEELKGLTFQAVTHDEDKTLGLPEMQMILAGEKRSAEVQKRYIRKDGTVVWGEVAINLIRDDEGIPLYYLSFIQDITKKKIIEEETRHERAIHQAVIDKSDAHLVYLDCDFNFLMVNASYAATCRKTPQELLGENHFDFYPHEENERIFKQVRDTGQTVSFKDRPFVFPDQPERGVTYWDWALSPVLDAAGQVCGLVFSLVETTGRKRLEEELERTAKEWQNTFNATNDAIWILDRDFRFLRTNKKAQIFFQRSSAELIGRRCWEVVHKTSAPIPNCPHVRVEKSLRRETLELQNDHLWFQVTVDPILDEAGRYAGAVHIISDITDRKHAEEALREQEVQYRHLADTGLALIWSAGTDKLCSYFNAPWLKFTGRTLEQERGNGWTEGVHPDDRERCFRIYHDAFDRRETFDVEYRLRNAEGIFRWIRDLGTPNFDSKGIFLGYIGHCFDVTSQKAAKEEILKLNRELEEKVQERTRELQKTVQDLADLNRVFIGRELRMAELKARIAELEKQRGSDAL